MSLESTDPDLLKFGENLARLRKEKGLSLRKLALLAGIEHHQLINIEKGRVDLRFSTLNKLAKGLEIDTKELLGPQ